MPEGKGTYGSKVGRPPARRNRLKAGPAAPRSKRKKDVNVPGEKARGDKGHVDHMVSVSEGRFNKMMKEIKAKRRVPHKSKIGWTLKD